MVGKLKKLVEDRGKFRGTELKKFSRYAIRPAIFGGVELKKGFPNFASTELDRKHYDCGCREERRLGLLVITIGRKVDAKRSALEEGVHEDGLELLLEVAKKNGTSSVRHLLLRTRRNEMMCDMKQSIYLMSTDHIKSPQCNLGQHVAKESQIYLSIQGFRGSMTSFM